MNPVDTDRKRVDEGHLSARFLTEYAEAPDTFDEDTVESIWAHLDVCDNCVDLYDQIKSGDAPPAEDTSKSTTPKADEGADEPAQALEVPPHSAEEPARATESEAAVTEDVAEEPPAPEPEPASEPSASSRPSPSSRKQPKSNRHQAKKPAKTRSLPEQLKVRWELILAASRPALIQVRQPSRIAAVAVAIVGALVALAMTLFFSRPPVVAHWASSEVFASKIPVQEVHVASVRGGRSKSAHTEVNLAGISALVVAVDLDRIPRRASSYDAAITTAEGAEVFRDEIAPAYFDDGRFMLRLVARQFQTGDYEIHVDAVADDGARTTIARGTFTATR